jgi:hypothetical protein
MGCKMYSFDIKAWIQRLQLAPNLRHDLRQTCAGFVCTYSGGRCLRNRCVTEL